MNASAVLARLQEAGVTVRAERGNLKLKGRPSALSETVLSELCRAKPEILKLLGNEQPTSAARGCLATWRARIESLPRLPDESAAEALAARRMEQLRDAALSFLDGAWALRAVEAGWNAVQLFGVNPASPERHYGAWGLVAFLAWSVHEPQLAGVDAAYALRTASGAELRKAREVVEAGYARPFWEMFAEGYRMSPTAARC